MAIFIVPMSRHLLFCVAFFCSTSATLMGQSVQWMPFNSSYKGSFQHKILGADRSGYYVYTSSGRERAVEKFSYTGNPLYSHKIPLEDRNIEIEELVVNKNEAVVFFSIYSGTLRKHGLFYMVLPHTGDAGKPTVIYDQDDIGGRSRSNFKIVTKDDLSGYSMVHVNESASENMALDIRFADAAMRVEQQTRLFLPLDKQRYELRKLMHDPQNNLLLWLQVTDKEKRTNDPTKFYYKLLSVNRITLELQEATLLDTVFFFNSVQPVVDFANNKVRVSGFFSERDRYQLAGAMHATVSLNPLRLDSIGFSRFDLEFKSRLLGSRSAKREKELADYFIRDLVVRSDGGTLLVAESNYETTQTYVQYSQGFPVYREIIYYHYDEIVVLSMNLDGTIDWRQIIPKAQITTQPSPYTSFVSFITDKHLNLVYNEEGRSKNAVLLYRINNQGDVLPRVILSPESDDAAILQPDAAVVTPTTLLLPAVKRKKKGIFRLTFELL